MENFVGRRVLVSKFGIAQHCGGETDTSDCFRRTEDLDDSTS